MPLSHSYWLDTSRCYIQRRKNSQQLFELFGSFSDTTPEKVRFDIIEHIMKNKEYYLQSGRTHLKKVKLSIDEWLDLMKSDSVFGDELMLFALANRYQKHAVVFTANRFWSTVGSDEPIAGTRLLEICEIHLLYTGKHMYGELKPRTFQPRIGGTKGGVPCGRMNEMDKVTKDTPCTVVHNVINNMDTHSDASPSIFLVPVAVHSAQGTNIMDIIETTEVVTEIPRECCDQAPNTEAIVDVGSDTSCDITESSESETDMSEMAKDNDVSGINSSDKAKIQNVNSIMSESGSAAECIDDIPGHHSLKNTDDNPESGIAAECAIEDFNVAPKNDTTELKDINDNPSTNNLPIPQEMANITGSSTMEMQCTMGTNNETVKPLKHSVLDKYSDGRLSGALVRINFNALDLPYSLGGPASENPASSTPSPTPIC